MNFDAIIIGGGVIGMLSALELKKSGLSIAILDKGALGGEASWAAGGIISSLYPWQQNSACEALISKSQKLFPNFTDELFQQTQIDPELICTGMLILDAEEKEHALDWANKNSTQPIQALPKQQLYELEPNLANKFNAALYLNNIYQIRPPKLLQALKKYLQKNGVEIFEHTEVKKLDINARQISSIKTQTDTMFSDKVIICSGAWTANLLQPYTRNITDIQPVRGQMLLFAIHEKTPKHIVLKQGKYLIPRKDGQLLCGSTVEHVGFDQTTTDDAANELHEFAQQIFPYLSTCSPIKQWSALRPGTNRPAPYICLHPEIENLYFNCGHYRYGIAMSLASAEILRELVINGVQLLPYKYSGKN